MPNGSDSYSIRAQSSSHRASVLAPLWSVLYVQSSKSVTQFQWNPSLVKQWEGYSLWPIFVETGLAFSSYVSSICNGLGLQCGTSSKKYAKDASFSDSSKICQPTSSWSPWERFALGTFLFFPEETPGLGDPRPLPAFSGSQWSELYSWVFPLHHQTVLLLLTYQSLLPSTLFPQEDPEWASQGHPINASSELNICNQWLTLT